jgi:predicted O-methyltransferase YrrM
MADDIHEQLAALEAELERWRTWRPPGHYYSPIPDREAVLARADELFDRSRQELPGIDLNLDRQQELMKAFIEGGFYAEQPFTADKQPGRRYFFDNDQYGSSDALFLYCMIRHVKPQRIIEVGSGYSSCLMLDTNELHFDGRIELTFIDPDPQRVIDNLHAGDREAIRLIEKPIQDVPIEEIVALEPNDILFVDSSHVAKIGSDVNRLLFEILPRLPSGVYVHVHDILWPFEYPREWIEKGIAWNEAYLLRAFLMFNTEFRIQLCNTYLEIFHEAWFKEHMPLCLKNPGGSLWLRKESRDPSC